MTHSYDWTSKWSILKYSKRLLNKLYKRPLLINRQKINSVAKVGLDNLLRNTSLDMTSILIIKLISRRLIYN